MLIPRVLDIDRQGARGHARGRAGVREGRGLERAVVRQRRRTVPRAKVSAAIERNLAPDGVTLSPKDVLAGFSCSRRNAEIRFRQATEKSVLEEIVAARMSRAKTPLEGATLSIPEIAAQCGYRYPANFRSAFITATGLNPLAWRKNNVKNA